jgi:hypothetical protein
MSDKLLKAAALSAVAATALGAESVEGEVGDEVVNDLIASIKEGDDEARGKAWQETSWQVGSPAVAKLADLMADGNFQVARAAKRAIWEIVRYSGRPDNSASRERVVIELLAVLGGDRPTEVQREVMWMLSEIAGDEAVEPVAMRLKNGDLREDARMVLQRLPGNKSLNALKSALESVPEDFKINVAQSLRARGEEVSGYPCQKMVPTRKTKVTPVQ